MRLRLGLAASAAAAALYMPQPAGAGVAHTVEPGETLWGISAVNGLTAASVASFNGIPADTYVLTGQTIHVPSVAEGGTPVSEPTAATETGSEGIPSAPGMGHIPSPWGDLHLDPGAADAWNAMREESLAAFGVDLYPGGTASAYRTYEQQAELYESYLSGQGAPASPPGTSAHETGMAVDVATPEMRDIIDQIGAKYGWAKVEAPDEWWHVNYVGG
jgi:LysM repeat protein